MTSSVIDVYIDYSVQDLSSVPTISIGPNISNYEADYLMIHFDELLQREISKNPNVIYNNKFQKFMKYVTEYQRILVNSRRYGYVVGPFGSPIKYFSCESGEHTYKFDDENYIEHAITLGLLEPKKYLNDSAIQNIINSIGPNTRYFNKCHFGLSKNFYLDVAVPTQDAWNEYFRDPIRETENLYTDTDKSMTNTFSKLNEEFNSTMASINDVLINGDYSTKYTIIQQKITDIVSLLENLVAASNTQENIIEQTIDNTDFYEKLRFDDKNIDPSLVIPKDTIDLVEKSLVQSQLNANIKKYSNMSTINILANTYNIPAQTQNIKNIGNLASNLLDTLTKSSNITNATQQLKDLMLTKIYIDDNGNQIASYLSDTDIDNLIQNELVKQKNYLDLISTNNYINNQGTISTVKYPGYYPSRLNMYDTKYQQIKLSTGGSKKLSKNLSKNHNKNITISQTGGRIINIKELSQKSNIMFDTIKDINKHVDDVIDDFQQQDENIFDNDIFVNFDSLNQRNMLLIEMMNILNIYNLLISDRVNNHDDTLKLLQKRSDIFKTNLEKYRQSIIKNNNTLDNNYILSTMLANGLLTTSEVKNLLNNPDENSDQNLQIDQITNDPILDNANMTKLISALVNKYSLNNTNLIVKNLAKILQPKINKIGTDKIETLNIEKTYRQLNTFYSTIQSLLSNLSVEYRNVEDIINNSNLMKQMTGNVIESNIQTFNIYIKQILESIQSFDLETKFLQDVKQQILLSKRRFSDLETFVKESAFSLKSKQNMLNDSHANLAQTTGAAVMNHNFTVTDIKQFYNNFVTNYLDKIAGASNNIIQYYSNDRDSEKIINNQYKLENVYFDYNIVRETISFSQNTTNGVDALIIDPTTLKINKNFNNLTRYLWRVINYFNGTEMLVFSHLKRKINIPTYISTIFDKFMVTNIPVLSTMLDKYFVFDTNSGGKFLQSNLSMTRNQQINLLKNIANMYLKNVSLNKEYGTYSQDLDDFVNEINTRKDVLSSKSNDQNISDFIDILKFITNVNYDITRIQESINDQLILIYKSIYGDEYNRVFAIDLKNEIINEVEIMITSIFDLFYQKISNLYHFYNGLLGQGDINKSSFSSLQKNQHDLSLMRINNDKIKIRENFNKALVLDNIFTPKAIGSVVTNPTICPHPFVTAYFNEKMYNNIHNLINCNHELLRVESKSINISDFVNEYSKFYFNILPVLSLMNDIFSSQNPIINIEQDVDLQQFNLISASQDLLTNSFIFNDNIIEINGDINGFGDFVINNLNINDTVFNDYLFDGELYAYIPSFINDELIINGSQLEYVNNSGIFMKINNFEINEIIITTTPPNNIINLSQIDTMIKLLNTGNYLIKFINMLNQNAKNLQTLSVEDIKTWNQSIDAASDKYVTRLSKKTKLLQALTDLLNIESIIKNKNDYFYLYNVLLGNNDPTNNITIITAKSIIENETPINVTFNENIDKIWIFTRKLINVWYTIFAHALSSLILNNVYGEMINFIKNIRNQIDVNLFDFTKYDDYINNADNYKRLLDSQFKDNLNKIQTRKNNYPINISYSDTSNNKFVIDDNTKNIIQMDNYYTNIRDNSTNVYVIIVLMNDLVFDELNNNFTTISQTTNNIINLVDMSDNYLNPDFIKSIIDSIPKPINSIDGLITLINNLKNMLMSNLQSSLKVANIENLYNPINEKITIGTNQIISAIRNFKPPFPKTKMTNFVMDRTYVLTNEILTSSGIFDVDKYLLAIKSYINKRSITLFPRLYITDIYKIIFDSIKQQLEIYMTTINSNIMDTHVIDFTLLRECFQEYFNSKRFNNILFSDETYLSNKITDFSDDSNSPNTKAILFTANNYNNNKKQIQDINDVIQNIISRTTSDIYDIYQTEINNYEILGRLNNKIIMSINNQKNNMQNKISKLRSMSFIMSQVMFDDYFKQYAFIDNPKLMQLMENIINNYESIWEMISQKIIDISEKNNYHLLTLSQINNYLAFKSAINKLIDNKAIINKIYKRMSFGLIEYYYDIMDTILVCLESKNFEDMSQLESYLYQNHYIQLKRCHTLFKWIRHDYQKNKQNNDEITIKTLKPGTNYNRILEYKIEPMRTTGDANAVFLEFQGLRRYLDEYSAVAMDKVQLHLRINDFVSKSYNETLTQVGKSKNIDTDFMLDYSPTSTEYNERLETNQLIFTNQNNGNNLKINFDLLEKIYQFNNPTSAPKNYNEYYNALYQKMKPEPIGVDFERIYNTKIFPESDVISNYMSIAPNIMNNKGTVIMTYGYSGVGKSASLFGRKMDVTKGVDKPSNGILQATLDQLFNVEIYFRVFEIYGLGTQYNYYWNPTSDGNLDCYPDFYQCIIHHVLDVSNPNTLRTSDQLIFTNRHDMLAYIMDLQNPQNGTNFEIKNVNDYNLQGSSGSSYNKYFNGNKMINSTYVKITEDHYRNFTDFVDDIDKVRSNGVHIKKLLTHVIRQIKGTINNPISSRSILVYDFEINLEPNKSGSMTQPIFIPFIIYDLPGKEDISRTYVDMSITKDLQGSTLNKVELRRRVFKDITNPPSGGTDSSSRERKSTYILNPLLIPIFDDNINVIKEIFNQISNSGSGFGPDNVKFNAETEENIVKEILDFTVDNFGVTSKKFIPSVKYKINGFYKKPDEIKTLPQLLSIDEMNNSYKSSDPNIIMKNLVLKKSIVAPNILIQKTYDADTIVQEINILVCVVIIGYLIKHKFFDIIVEIINRIVEGPGGSNNDDDGNWSTSKIYAFFEAYYINENVVGLLQYLITRVLNKSSNILEQESTIHHETIDQTISTNYRVANRYRTIRARLNLNSDSKIGRTYGIAVNTNLLTSSDVLKTKEIQKFIETNNVRPSGVFFTNNTPTIEVSKRMNNVIAFENQGDYDNNKIFRAGNISYSCYDSNDPDDNFIINPRKAIINTEPAIIKETNRPLLQDFIEAYEQKISFYYIFYVISNSQSSVKAEEQVKLLNNSMPFIEKMDPVAKKKQCV
ncbi:kinesin-like protein [Cotonvirus japonicus]|uniref:Kinesin-like protein n=1 Tax=Cotonvirus japonicus TaxID=2811091 RepID=A0ABM7NSZ7_9VIRU|nr:kinesin-like protein [Cotonvirus japonicus]BCS83298.1 kinesin-like protein [Cotonvirus japonicus]